MSKRGDVVATGIQHDYSSHHQTKHLETKDFYQLSFIHLGDKRQHSGLCVHLVASGGRVKGKIVFADDKTHFLVLYIFGFVFFITSVGGFLYTGYEIIRYFQTGILTPDLNNGMGVLFMIFVLSTSLFMAYSTWSHQRLVIYENGIAPQVRRTVNFIIKSKEFFIAYDDIEEIEIVKRKVNEIEKKYIIENREELFRSPIMKKESLKEDDLVPITFRFTVIKEESLEGIASTFIWSKNPRLIFFGTENPEDKFDRLEKALLKNVSEKVKITVDKPWKFTDEEKEKLIENATGKLPGPFGDEENIRKFADKSQKFIYQKDNKE